MDGTASPHFIGENLPILHGAILTHVFHLRGRAYGISHAPL